MSEEKEHKPQRKHDMSDNDPLDLYGEGWDGQYVGNIWGWRFSLISLAIILLVGGLMAFRYWQLGYWEGEEPPGVEAPIDTFKESSTEYE